MRASRTCYSSRLRENYIGTPERRWPCVWTIKEYTRRMLKKARLLTRPTLARRDAPYPMQGRSSEAYPRFTFHTSRFTVFGSEARTPLADFFSNLLRYPVRRISGRSSRSAVINRGERTVGVPALGSFTIDDDGD